MANPNFLYYIIRKASAPGSCAQMVCSYNNQADALQDIQDRNSDPSSSGLYESFCMLRDSIISCGNIISINESVNQTGWQTLVPFVFDGTETTKSPIRFNVCGYLNNSGKKGYIRVFDVTHNKTIATVEFNGEIVSTLKFTETLNNLPSNESIFEIQAKTDSGGTLMVQSAELK